jgi:thiamine biosynthesis lipoprotein
MKRFLSLFLALSCIVLSVVSFSSCDIQPKKKFKAYYFDYFDTATTIVGWEKSQEDFDRTCEIIKSELEFYHKQYTIYNSYEGINNICALNKKEKGVHKELKVDESVIDLLLYCKELYSKTDGKLNVAMGSVLSIWHDYRNDGMNNPVDAKLPPMEKLEEASRHTSMDCIIIDAEKGTVFISDPEVRLDVGAVAKGWAAQRAAEHAPAGMLMSVGGNVCATGPKYQGTPWVIGVRDPAGAADDYLHTLYVSGGSVVTSGDYQRTYMVEGKLYHHIIDPDTLMPSEYWRSVTVVSPDSGLADALSTALFLLDREEGQRLLDACGAEAMWVDGAGNCYYSPAFRDIIRT